MIRRFFPALLMALVVLNFADAGLTVCALRLGIATEANPIMAFLIGLGQPVFLAVKTLAVTWVSLKLWSWREETPVQWTTLVLTLGYVGVCINNILVFFY